MLINEVFDLKKFFFCYWPKVDLEATVHSRLSSLLEILEKKPLVKEKEDVELSRASELMRVSVIFGCF